VGHILHKIYLESTQQTRINYC